MNYKYHIYVNDRNSSPLTLEGERLNFRSYVHTDQTSTDGQVLSNFAFSIVSDSPSYSETRRQMKEIVTKLKPLFSPDKDKNVHLIVDFYSYGYQQNINIEEFDAIAMVYDNGIQEKPNDPNGSDTLLSEINFTIL